jgi:hypothetical protein
VARPISWAIVVFEKTDGGRVELIIESEHAPDLELVAALARLQLLCRRSGMQVHLEEFSPMLKELLELSGLRRQVVGKPERGEETLSIEKGVDPRDPVA